MHKIPRSQEYPGEPTTSEGGLIIILDDSPDLEEILHLLKEVLDVNPEYLPGVSTGTVTAREWLIRKNFAHYCFAYTLDGNLAGHGALRLNGVLPDGRLLPRPYSWELGGVFVRPGSRGRGIAREIVEHLTEQVISKHLWSCSRYDGLGEKVLASAGWSKTEEDFTWSHGVVMPGHVWAFKRNS